MTVAGGAAEAERARLHVAIVGMGALGRVYGVRLARRAACEVTFVVRTARPSAPVHLQRIDGDGAADSLDAPTVAVSIPDAADVILVCVRAEQLDPALDRLLEAEPDVPVVVLTPMLPPDLDRMVRVHGARLRAAMPGVVSYFTPDGGCRYWLPRVAPTLVDAEEPVPASVHDLVRALATAGFGGRLEPRVHETNPATTISFIPLAMGVDAAGGVEALLGDSALLRLTLDAVGEGLALAARVGHTPTWIDLLARFAGPLSLRIGVGIVRSRAPEALTYVEEHFGRKLHAQNVAMARTIVGMAGDKGVPAVALGRLLERLER